MEKEISSAVGLATSMVAISIVITLVIYTIIVGNGFKEEVFASAVTLQTQISSGQLRDMSSGYALENDTEEDSYAKKIIMPKAAIYAILSQEHNVINSIEYTKNNENKSGTLKVKIKALPNGLWGDENGLIDTEYVFPEDVMSNELSGKVEVVVYSTEYNTYDVKVKNVK